MLLVNFIDKIDLESEVPFINGHFALFPEVDYESNETKMEVRQNPDMNN